ncbi:COG4648 family protein [Acinetobacter qingfengensis]
MLIYPFAVAWALSQGQWLWLSAGLMLVALLRYFLNPDTLFAPLTLLALFCGGLSLLLKDSFWLKFYPVLMSLGSFVIFAMTLKYPPSMIERFARLHQDDFPESARQWTKRVTQVWCGFFIINALIALVTVLFASNQIWAVYNGFISYLLMGVLLLGEWVLRKRHQARHMADLS